MQDKSGASVVTLRANISEFWCSARFSWKQTEPSSLQARIYAAALIKEMFGLSTCGMFGGSGVCEGTFGIGSEWTLAEAILTSKVSVDFGKVSTFSAFWNLMLLNRQSINGLCRRSQSSPSTTE